MQRLPPRLTFRYSYPSDAASWGGGMGRAGGDGRRMARKPARYLSGGGSVGNAAGALSHFAGGALLSAQMQGPLKYLTEERPGAWVGRHSLSDMRGC